MGKESGVALNGFWRDWFQFGLYKRSQGRITRQATFAVLALLVILGAWRLSAYVGPGVAWKQIGVPGVLAVVGVWLSFRLVNWPQFADFLIAVEAEMGKVSWPTRKELFRGSIVVMVTIFSLATMLTAYDFVWHYVLILLRVVKS